MRSNLVVFGQNFRTSTSLCYSLDPCCNSVNGRLNSATNRELVRTSILAKVGRSSSAMISKAVNGRLSSFTNSKEHHLELRKVRGSHDHAK